MDDKVIEFGTGRPLNAFSHLAKDDRGLGYNVVPKSLALQIFQDLRGKDCRDCASFVVRREGESHLLGTISIGGDKTLTDGYRMRECCEFALANVPKIVRASDVRVVKEDDGHSAVYVRGDEAVFGVCYYDNAKSAKGAMMAALLLYAFAFLNMFIDFDLFKNAFSYLPFVPSIGLDIRFFLNVEELVEGVAEQS